MIYVYLFAAIIGVVLLLASVVAGDHGHAGGHDVGHGSDAASGTGALALQIFSLRVWTYFLAFGGATGLLLRWLAHTPEPTAAIAAGSVGVVTAVFARAVIARAMRSDRTGTVQRGDFVGRSAGVVVPFGKGTTGKVRVRVQGSEVDLLATTDDGAALLRDDEVMIVEVRDGAAIVTRHPIGPDETAR